MRKNRTNRLPCRPAGPHGRASAFTLVEILIALGIVGVGISMAAMAFPVGIKLNERSYNDSVGMIVCENGLNLAATVLTSGDVSGQNLQIVIDELDDPNTNFLPPADQHYPSGTVDDDLVTGERLKGFVVFAREDGTNGAHQLIAVSYRRARGHTVAAASNLNPLTITDNDDKDGSILTLSDDDDANFFKKGAPVLTLEGQFATIVAVRKISGAGNDEIEVKPRLLQADGDPIPDNTAIDVWTVVDIAEEDPDPDDPDSWPITNRTPCMAVMAVRTALR